MSTYTSSERELNPGLGVPDDGSPLALLAAAERDLDPTVAEEVQTTVNALLPWGISILFHAGLVMIAVFIVWSTVAPARDAKIVVPISRLSATPGAPLQVSEKQRLQRSTTTQQRQLSPTETPRELVATTLDTDVPLLGPRAASTPFRSSLAAQSQFKTSFLGTGGNARDIVFVIDASGSQIDRFPMVLEELGKSIQKLSARQSFTVIFFKQSDAIEIKPTGMKRATPANKKAAGRWLDPRRPQVTPGYSSNPMTAIKLALSYDPDLVFFLADDLFGKGVYEVDQKDLLAQIEEANRAGTKFNTIEFVDDQHVVHEGLKATMQLIAEQTGGVYNSIRID